MLCQNNLITFSCYIILTFLMKRDKNYFLFQFQNVWEDVKNKDNWNNRIFETSNCFEPYFGNYKLRFWILPDTKIELFIPDIPDLVPISLISSKFISFLSRLDCFSAGFLVKIRRQDIPTTIFALESRLPISHWKSSDVNGASVWDVRILLRLMRVQWSNSATMMWAIVTPRRP